MRWVSVGLLVATGLAAAATLVSTGWLYGQYRPHAPGVEPWLLTAADRSALEWIHREDRASAALLVLAGLSAVACLLTALVVRRWSWFVALAASLVAVGGALLSIATTASVRWQQLALWAVTTGTDLKGYEAATRTPLVRFVIVDGREVSTTDYEVNLVLHVLGPVVALVATVVAGVVVLVWGSRRGQEVIRRTNATSSATASTASGKAG